MKVLAICGSPRDGATKYALEEALKEIEKYSPDFETEIWSVRGKKISPCVHCDSCIRNKTMCIIQDDFKELEEKILNADAILIGSPIYMMGITAQLKATFDRLRPAYLVHPGQLRNKVGGALVTGGTRHGGQETTLQNIQNFYLMYEMLAIGGLGGCYSGGTVWSKDGKAEGAAKDKVGMDTVIRMAQAFAEAVIVTTEGRKKLKKLIDIAEPDSPLRDH